MTTVALRGAGAAVGVLDLKRGAWDGAFAEADVADEIAVARAFDARVALVGTLRALLNTTGIGHSGLSTGPGRSDWWVD